MSKESLSKKPNLNPGDYEQLGKWLQDIVESGNVNSKRLMKAGFMKGIASGVGGILGATVVISLLVWVLSLLHHVPLVNRVTDNLRATVQQPQSK